MDPGEFPRQMNEIDTSWLKDAACRGIDPDLFFPSKGMTARFALAVCHRCNVQSECLIDALNSPKYLDMGVRGGLSERARRPLRGWLRQSKAGAL